MKKDPWPFPRTALVKPVIEMFSSGIASIKAELELRNAKLASQTHVILKSALLIIPSHNKEHVMPIQYVTLPAVTMTKNKSITRVQEPPQVVHLNDAAVNLMIDFKIITPLCITDDHTMFQARMKMQQSNLHIILVFNDQDELVGLLSQEQILSEDPIKMIHDTRITSRKEVPITQVMTPIESIQAINLYNLEHASVGSAIKTLNEWQQDYALVVEIDQTNLNRNVRGVLLASHIRSQLGEPFRNKLTEANTVVELTQTLDI